MDSSNNSEAQIPPNRNHPATKSWGQERKHRAVWIGHLSCPPPRAPTSWRDPPLPHQLTLICTISRKTCFKESIFKKTTTQKTTFPLLWEISFSAISKVKLKFYCTLSHKKLYFSEAQKVKLCELYNNTYVSTWCLKPTFLSALLLTSNIHQ